VSEDAEAVVLGARLALGFVFLSASIPKLFASAEFARAVRNYGLLPTRLNEPVALWLPRIELALAIVLIAGVATRAAAALVAVMLVAFTGAVSVNLARGRRIDCGCYSSVSPRAIGWTLVLRNLALVCLALAVVIAPPDGLSISALSSDRAAELSVAEGLAIAVVAATLVLVQLLADEAIRVRRAMRPFARRPETHQ
jgi:putative oxidoreductase